MKMWHCKGSGSKPGHNVGSCSMCGGHGQVRSSQGFYTQQTCPQCSGSGEEITNPAPVVEDRGKTIIQEIICNYSQRCWWRN